MNLIAHLKQCLLGSFAMGAVITTSVIVMPVITSTPALANTAQNAQDNLVAVKRLNALLANTKTLSANFTQTTQSGKGKTVTFSGSMQVKRPNLFRWETKKPNEQLIISNGDTLWIYDKDLAQATKQSADQTSNTPALLLSGDTDKIAKNFTITQPNPQKNYYKLFPKDKEGNFKSLAISFNGGKPVMMVLEDNLGQTTLTKFSNIKINAKLADAQFQFTLPKGVDLIEQ